MNYQETIDFLFAQLPMFQRQGAAAYKANLNNTHAFCEYLGNPELEYPSIHVAGTNGKGSTSHMIASFLQESEYKVGLYTSPHLKDFRERIRVNGEMVSEKFVVDFVAQNKEYISELRPSFFEITFAMAIQYFKEQGVDYAIMETGMGGRLDSTNVVRSILSVITNISLDHTQFLGDTLPLIAGEKAGIIKPKVPVVIGQRQEEIENVFISKASELEAPICFSDDLISVSEANYEEHMLKFMANDKNNDYSYPELVSPLAGDYQIHNLKTFLAVVSVLKSQNIIPVNLSLVKSSLLNLIENTGMQGRWQILSREPLCITDTGHNEAGISHIVKQFSSISYKKLHFVLGMVSDKSIDALLQMLPKDAHYYFCKANIPRALAAEELTMKAKMFGLNGEMYESVQEAYSSAMKNAKSEDLVFVGGSTFVVAEVL
jgi:dihydrofolate synthase/folylpolyglutamate synthase